MQFKNLIVLAGLASAAPNPDVVTFKGTVLRSASPIHHQPVQASMNGFAVKMKDQGASCDRGAKENEATFTLNKKTGELLLYSRSNPRQQVWVDRSGMGQGLMGYRTGAQPLCNRCEQDKWAINKDGLLQYDGTDYRACPQEDGSYTLWVSNVYNPGGNKNCVGASIVTSKIDEPVGCLYSQQGQ
ncbi:hypothetical protein NW768_008768 [Fusarium equiseti]|uniref:Cell wall protein n=1 Tax=Fusarium equiseti TaxID=61235 RepID=A0ABQ8R5B7_FUSEQ|nr:hypothetical protein NW768_008768 [Fusarium equiseti]